MNTIRGIKLRWLHETLTDVTYQMTRLQLTPVGPYRWRPAINAFQCDKGLRICVDLAGVDRSQVDLIVEPQRLLIRGTREAPEPTDDEGRAVQMIAFEIDYGPFERIVELPFPVVVKKARAEQRNGFLWIDLPFPQ
jgi:HSP20 family protein